MFKEYEIRCFETTKENGLREFIVENHYSKYVSKGCRYNFGLYINKKLIGAAQVGRASGTHAASRYQLDTGKVLELRKLCLIDNTPKNTESWFIAKILKYMKQNVENLEGILSYADPNVGHEGTIYKASNFLYVGEQRAKNNRVIKYKNKTYHSRTAFNDKVFTYKELTDLLRKGKAKWVLIKPKHIYMYYFDKTLRKTFDDAIKNGINQTLL